MEKTQKNYFNEMSDEDFSALDFKLFLRAVSDMAEKTPNQKNTGAAKIITRMNELKLQNLLLGKA